MSIPYDEKLYSEVFGDFYYGILEQHPDVSADAAATAAATLVLVSRTGEAVLMLKALNDNLGKQFADMRLIVGMEPVEPPEPVKRDDQSDWEAPF